MKRPTSTLASARLYLNESIRSLDYEGQLQDAATYLDEARSGTGIPFVDDVEAILLVASEHPEIFPRVPRVKGNDVRRALVRRYGYWIIYEIHRHSILVLSVWHGTREPDRWQQE